MINVSFSVSHINDEFLNNFANVAFDFIQEKVNTNNNMWLAIKNNIVSKAQNEYNNAVSQKDNNPNSRKYDEIIKNNPNNVNFDKSKSIINILDKHLTNKIEILKNFLKYSPKKLNRISKNLYIANDKERFWFKYFMSNIFDWKSFSARTQVKKLLFEYCKSLKIGVCPYCNRNFISILSESQTNPNIRPSLDHFYPKDLMPCMALCLWNLIPTCDYCNSKIKLAKNTLVKKILNPYIDGFDESVKFKLEYKKANDIVFFINNIFKFYTYEPNEEDFSLFFIYKNNDKSLDSTIKKATNSIEFFRLNELYQNHIELAVQTFARAYLYNLPSYVDSVSQVLINNKLINNPDLKKIKEFMMKVEFDKVLDSKNDCNEQLAKFKRDIIDQAYSNYNPFHYSNL